MLHRSPKCSFCGSRENLSRCSCGRSYCPVHGFGGRCTECYSKTLVSSPEVPPVDEGRKQGKPRSPEKPAGIGASLRFAKEGTGDVVGDLCKTLRNHHFLCYAQRRVALLEREREIEVLFHGDRIMNTIGFEPIHLDILTKPNRIAANALKRLGDSAEGLGSRLPKIPPSGRYEVYKALVHHNEFCWLTQASLLSTGITLEEASMQWRLKSMPVKAYGPLCPFCGSSVVVEGLKCRYCHKPVPEEIAADEFLIGHLRRQFTDKLVGLRMLFQEGEISPEQYRLTRERYIALKGSLDRVMWSG